MNEVGRFIVRLGRDEGGAALVEYTVLLGILLGAIVVTITLVGNWISSSWSALYAPSDARAFSASIDEQTKRSWHEQVEKSCQSARTG
jgi:pilus assembly protein Flp/PilA